MKKNYDVNKALVEEAEMAKNANLSYGQYKAGMQPDTEKDTYSKVNFWWKKEM